MNIAVCMELLLLPPAEAQLRKDLPPRAWCKPSYRGNIELVGSINEQAHSQETACEMNAVLRTLSCECVCLYGTRTFPIMLSALGRHVLLEF